MALHYISGRIDENSFQQFCERQKIDPQKAVYIFPGNNGHHGKNHNLYSYKNGAGLAVLAGQLTAKGRPVLSLPTTGMESWSENEDIKRTVSGAIADLWRAYGAGYDLVLPVREHGNQNYFSKALDKTSLEPNFWGGIQKSPNKPLADHYIAHLNLLAQFSAIENEEEKNQFLKALAKNHPALHAAFLEGQKMLPEDPWLRQSEKKTSAIKKPIPAKQDIKAPLKQETKTSPELEQHTVRISEISLEPASKKSDAPRASTVLMIGSGLLAAGGAVGLLLGSLAMAGVISLFFPPLVFLIAGGAAAAAGLAGFGIFAVKRLLEKDTEAPDCTVQIIK